MTTAVQLSTALDTFAPEGPVDWTRLAEFARGADDAGIDRLIASDHVVFGEHLDAYANPSLGGTRGGTQPTGPDGLWLEPMITLAHLSGLTSRVRFQSGILIAALRRPVVLAKMAATLDVLSNGRFDLGVGVGSQREEYEAAGLSFEGRGRLLNHTLEVCQKLWRDTAASYQSNELSFARIHQMPKPVQEGGVPVWVSGTVNKHSMDRLAAFGTGWIPWGDDRDDIKGAVQKMRVAMIERGRDPDGIGVVGDLAAVRDERGKVDVKKTMSGVPGLIAVGVSDVRVRPLVAPRGQSAAFEFLSEVVAAFREMSA